MNGFYHWFFDKTQYNILFVGLDGSGKTTLLEQIKRSEGRKAINLDKITPTAGLNITKIESQRHAEFNI